MADDPGDKVDIFHDEQRQRFETIVDGHLGVLDYRLQPGLIVFTHTGVPKPIGGRGIAASLTRAGLDFARARGLRVRPLCSYVAAFMRRHPVYQDLLE